MIKTRDLAVDLRADPDDLPDCQASITYGMIPPLGAEKCPNKAEWRWVFEGCDCGQIVVHLCSMHHYRELALERKAKKGTDFLCTRHPGPEQKTKLIRRELIR